MSSARKIPEAPVFRPTAAQWKDTLGYIKYAQSQAEHAGICRIIPPKNWNPPFAVDKRNFRFKTRIQNLSMIDGVARVEKEFTVKLRKFLFEQGTPVGVTPLQCFHSCKTGVSEPVNLYRLLKAVTVRGGYDRVCRDDTWRLVGSDIDMRITNRNSIELCHVYEQYLLVFERYRAARKQENQAAAQGRLAKNKRKKRQERSNETSSDDEEEETETSRLATGGIERGTHAARVAAKEVESLMEVCELARVLADRIAKRRKEWIRDEYGSDISDGDEPMSIKQQSTSNASDEADDDKQIKQTESSSTQPPILPKPKVGARFYKFFDSLDSCLRGTVISATHRRDPVYTVHFAMSTEWGSRGGGKNNEKTKVQTMDRDTLIMHIASGGSRKEAKDAHEKGICQTCMRANDLHLMLECDGCDFTYHTQCLEPKLDEPPDGDWFCDMCIGEQSESEKKALRFMSVTAVPELATFGFGDGETEMTLDGFKVEADVFKETLFANHDESDEDLEDPLFLQHEFWSLISKAAEDAATVCGEAADIKVAYGSDIDTGAHGSGFPTAASMARLQKALNHATAASARYPRNNELRNAREEAKRLMEEHEKYLNDGWNLNNLPRLNGSLLQYVEGDITGILKPWLYVGMCFSSFCWHTEDHYFASINYVHWGQPKTWYGVPSSHADAFETAAKELAPELFEVRPDILTGIVTMFNPFDMLARDVPVYRTTQSPGEFVVTFPRAYHGGFNNGFNCAEAVNFATPEWLPFGGSCLKRYKELKKMPVVAHDSFICNLADLCRLRVESVETARHVFPHLVRIIADEINLRSKIAHLPVGTANGFHQALRALAASNKAIEDGRRVAGGEGVSSETRTKSSTNNTGVSFFAIDAEDSDSDVEVVIAAPTTARTKAIQHNTGNRSIARSNDSFSSGNGASHTGITKEENVKVEEEIGKQIKRDTTGHMRKRGKPSVASHDNNNMRGAGHQQKQQHTGNNSQHTFGRDRSCVAVGEDQHRHLLEEDGKDDLADVKEEETAVTSEPSGGRLAMEQVRQPRMDGGKGAVTRMGMTVNPGEATSDVERQNCFKCMSFCSLSFAYGIRRTCAKLQKKKIEEEESSDESSESDDDDDDSNTGVAGKQVLLVSCLSHVRALKKRCDNVKVVSVQPEERLVELAKGVGLRAVQFERWQERCRRLLASELQPDTLFGPNVGEPWPRLLELPTVDYVAELLYSEEEDTAVIEFRPSTDRRGYEDEGSKSDEDMSMPAPEHVSALLILARKIPIADERLQEVKSYLARHEHEHETM